MKKVLVLLAALALAATPAAAQESQAPTASMQQQGAPVRAPSLFVSPDQIRQRVAAAEAERAGAQTQQGHVWYYAAAIAIGVLIAVLLLDS